ncbi:hypothetical protein RRG08_044030 [Elysia crispata]|uniref:Tetraspanin n=1 Tax=Elysia crispata TaxID=231223 RepID=A0AAE0Y2W9_9GAST|nr:hypothetical protein RRG08_044030 [Elysia crispata]
MSSGSEGMQKMLPEAHPRKKHPLHPLCARTAFSCNKLFLFIYALIFLFVGIVLMAIGTLVELHRSRIEPINNRLAVPTALVIFVGLAIAVNALVGMIGTVMEKPCLLKVFLVVTVLCFLLQVTIGIIAFIFREERNGDAGAVALQSSETRRMKRSSEVRGSACWSEQVNSQSCLTLYRTVRSCFNCSTPVDSGTGKACREMLQILVLLCEDGRQKEKKYDVTSP